MKYLEPFFKLYRLFMTNDGEASSKKIFAFILVIMAIMSKVELYFWPDTHWTIQLAKHGLDSSIIISLIASFDALAAWALGVYGWTKSKGV